MDKITGRRTTEDGAFLAIPQEQLKVFRRRPIARRPVILLELIERFFHRFRHEAIALVRKIKPNPPIEQRCPWKNTARKATKTLQVARTIKNRLKTSGAAIVSEVSRGLVREVRELELELAARTHSCLVTGFSSFSHTFSPARSPSYSQYTSRRWRAVCHEKHFDCWQPLQSDVTQRGQSTLPHLSTVSGTGRPASSQ
uniref:Uncharacterized protein n=1 Tax=Anopheles farauti TaxID=69004 RepID=A0A182QSD6_9DIPT